MSVNQRFLPRFYIDFIYQQCQGMSAHKEIQTIHKISEVLAEAFAKVKYISEEYLSSHPKDSKEKLTHKERIERAREQAHERPKNSQDKAAKKNQQGSKGSKESNISNVSEEKQGKKEVKERKEHDKKKAHPEKPKHPMTSNFRFNQENMSKVKEEEPQLGHTQVISVLSKIWAQMSHEEREPYEAQYQADMDIYEQELNYFYSRHPEQRPKSHKHKPKKDQ